MLSALRRLRAPRRYAAAMTPPLRAHSRHITPRRYERDVAARDAMAFYAYFAMLAPHCLSCACCCLDVSVIAPRYAADASAHFYAIALPFMFT